MTCIYQILLQPPSYSVAVRSQDTGGPTVQNVSGFLVASQEGNTYTNGDTYKDDKISDKVAGPEAPAPPSYTVAAGEDKNRLALHRSPPDQYAIPGINGLFQPFKGNCKDFKVV